MRLGENFGDVDKSPKGRATVKAMIAALGIPLALGGCANFDEFGKRPVPSISKGERRVDPEPAAPVIDETVEEGQIA